MKTISIDFRFFLECDSSPFILFGNSGKIIYLNDVAEILLGYVTPKELYDVAISYAPKDFGYKTTRLEMQYDTFSFYAVNVAYENEEQIGLRLYHRPRTEPQHLKEIDKLPLTDINTLLEANITLFKLQNENDLELLTDQDLPPCRVDQNQFSKLLRKTLHNFRASDSIQISLKLIIGEYILIRDRREQIIQFSISANGRYTDGDTEIKEIAQDINAACILKEHAINIQIPYIQ